MIQLNDKVAFYMAGKRFTGRVFSVGFNEDRDKILYVERKPTKDEISKNPDMKDLPRACVHIKQCKKLIVKKKINYEKIETKLAEKSLLLEINSLIDDEKKHKKIDFYSKEQRLFYTDGFSAGFYEACCLIVNAFDFSDYNVMIELDGCDEDDMRQKLLKSSLPFTERY